MDGPLTQPAPRTPFQGVANIVRFNWPFFAVATVGILGLLLAAGYVPTGLAVWVVLAAGAVLITTLISLAVSHYVYDRSNLYTLDWLRDIPVLPGARLVNINAGFDETSALLAQTYPSAQLQVFDFYDPARHTEASIERARRAYPPYPGTRPITTDHVPVSDSSTDVVLLILAAHEIRDEAERVRFFRELARTLKPGGRVVVVEHLRDVPNFLAYTIGFLHFHSRRTWLATFQQAGFAVADERKITPFISAFFLTTDGDKS